LVKLVVNANIPQVKTNLVAVLFTDFTSIISDQTINPIYLSFQEKLKSLELVLEDLLVKASDYMKDEDSITPRFKRIREIALSDFDSMNEEDKNRLLAEKEELYRQQENSTYRVMSDDDLANARFVFEQLSKLIGEMYSRINLYDGKMQWMNDMIRYIIPLNYLPEYDSYNESGSKVEFNPKELYVERFKRR
jgi:hypothetical protein